MTIRTAAFLWVSAAPSGIEPLVDLLASTFTAFEERSRHMCISATSGVREVVYNGAKLTKAMRSAETRDVAVWSASEPPLYIDLCLRDDPRHAGFIDHRVVVLTCPSLAPDDRRLLQFLETVCEFYPVAHGGVVGAATRYDAWAESTLVGYGELERARQDRITFDSEDRRALHLLRRLYPITIIGPAIWASLPPLPEVQPPVIVRDVADCKMITAWPELVDAHDLQFLLGTRALRRWLWPHTIRNPADDPDEVDVRLKWAELLPW